MHVLIIMLQHRTTGGTDLIVSSRVMNSIYVYAHTFISFLIQSSMFHTECHIKCEQCSVVTHLVCCYAVVMMDCVLQTFYTSYIASTTEQNMNECHEWPDNVGNVQSQAVSLKTDRTQRRVLELDINNLKINRWPRKPLLLTKCTDLLFYRYVVVKLTGKLIGRGKPYSGP